VVFEDSQISNASLAAIMAYVKKREYGPGQVTARNIDMHQVTREAVVQRGSRVRIDGVEQEAEDVDVESLYRVGHTAR
jgi:hypothetical protein